MPGVGGTGVVTVSAILQMAAHLDGRHASGLEQTGLAQKGGPVVSDVRISARPIEGQLRAGAASADLILGFDLLGAAASETLAVADRRRTVAVLNTAQTPTARMVTDPSEALADTDLALKRVGRATRSADNVHVDASGLSHRLFGDHMPANMLLVGAAYQQGCLPIGHEAIEHAIEMNGAAVESNLAAFRWGRAAVADPDAVARAMAPAAGKQPDREPDPRAMDMLDGAPLTGELRRVVQLRVGELIAYQSRRYAQPLPGRGRARGPDRARADRRRQHGGPGLRPRAAQADGLQGRVRGGPAAPAGRRGGAPRRPSSDPAPRCRSCSSRRC